MTGTVNCVWKDVPRVLSPFLSRGITIFYGITAELLKYYDACWILLSSDEKAKAQRFHLTTDRERYVIQHGYLRNIMGGHLDIDGDELSFSFGPTQKPYLVGYDNVYFNLSNSSGHFLIAIGDTEMGVDIEVINPKISYKDIATNYFSKEEVAFIDAAVRPAKAFYLLWTRKEALLKACGMGIDDDLPAVPALDGLHNLPGKYPVKQWWTGSFDLGHDVMVSITCTGRDMPMQFVRLDSREF